MNLDFILKLWSIFKKTFKRLPGGYKNPLNYFLLFCIWWAIKAFLKERGWVPKKRKIRMSIKGFTIFRSWRFLNFI